MVSNKKLREIHIRLEEVFLNHSNKLTVFGNKNMLVFGDLFQVYKY